MGPLNSFMNKMDEISQPINHITRVPQGAFKRHVLPSIGTPVVGTPLEVLAVAQNIVTAPVQLAGAGLNLAVRALTHISSAKCLRDFSEKLPTLSDFFRTLGRVVAYAIGTLFTATLGFFSPSANFKLHCAFGLTTHNREEAVRAAEEAATAVQFEQEAELGLQEEIARQRQQDLVEAPKVEVELARVNAEPVKDSAEVARVQEDGDTAASQNLIKEKDAEGEIGDEDFGIDDEELRLAFSGNADGVDDDDLETDTDEMSQSSEEATRRFDTIRKYTTDRIPNWQLADKAKSVFNAAKASLTDTTKSVTDKATSAFNATRTSVTNKTKSVVSFVTRGYFFGNNKSASAA